MDTLTKSCSPTIVITVNGEVQTHEEAIVYVKELEKFLTKKVLENTPAVLSLGKLCVKTDILMNGSMVKNHISFKTGFGFPATRRTSFIVVPGLSNSSSRSDSPTSRTLSRQGSHCSTSSSSSSSSPTVSEIQTREREDQMRVTSFQYLCQLRLMKDRSDPMITKPGKIQKQTKNPRGNKATRCVLKSRSGCKNSEKNWWMMKFQNIEILTPVLLMKSL